MKQIMFSRVFPAYHPRKGELTYFQQKIWKGLLDINCNGEVSYEYGWTPKLVESDLPKFHTIRAGKRWKEGEYFAPKVWTGLPYRSKTFQFAPPIKIEKIWNFSINKWGVFIDGISVYNLTKTLPHISLNDGLELNDWKEWFKYPSDFRGQIICWNKKIDYY